MHLECRLCNKAHKLATLELAEGPTVVVNTLQNVISVRYLRVTSARCSILTGNKCGLLKIADRIQQWPMCRSLEQQRSADRSPGYQKITRSYMSKSGREYAACKKQYDDNKQYVCN